MLSAVSRSSLASMIVLACACGSDPRPPPVTSDAGRPPQADAGDAGIADAAVPDTGVEPARLTSLTPSRGSLQPAFSPDVLEYRVRLPPWVTSIRFTAASEAPISVEGAAVPSGMESADLLLEPLETAIELAVGEGPARATYQVLVERSPEVWMQQAYIKAPNADVDDDFGSAVAISGDVLVVGARGEDSSGANMENNTLTDSGAVYVYRRTGFSWSFEAYLKASNPGANDAFGRAVAIDGDTIVVGAAEDSSGRGVGAAQDNNDAENSGAVYVFVRRAGVWEQQVYLKASNADPHDNFGGSVAIEGDRIAVGAVAESSAGAAMPDDNSVEFSGAIYVFERTAGVWVETARLKSDQPRARDQLGGPVSLSGDRIAAGAFSESSNVTGVNPAGRNELAMDSGAAIVFVYDGMSWRQEAFIKAPVVDARDFFAAVSIKDDLLVVGATGEDSSSAGVGADPADNRLPPFSGAAYVYRREAAGWVFQTFIKAEVPSSEGRFGSRISIADSRIMIAAQGDPSSARGLDGDESNADFLNAGAFHLYDESAGAWSRRGYFKASNPGNRDYFAVEVAASGRTLVAGAQGESSDSKTINGDGENDRTIRSGAVYVFE